MGKENEIFTSWRNKWENLTVYFEYPDDIRRVIYTTNIIESVHRQFRTLTKTKGAEILENDVSLDILFIFVIFGYTKTINQTKEL